MTSIASRYLEDYSTSVGAGLSSDDIEDLATYIEDARVADNKHRNEVLVYEILQKPDWEKKIGPFADKWSADAENIRRASTHVGRDTCNFGPALVRGFCIFRLKEFPTTGWISMAQNLRIDRGQAPQTVVFVALTDLSPANGFFITLNKGQDVCIDGNAILQFPATGGGRGIFISLNI